MPDTTSSQSGQSRAGQPHTDQPSQADKPPGADGRPDLGALRARLDAIDDKIHDLLMDRARVVEGVARSGKTAAFRPGREASILRRLLGRHAGALPARTLVRMWREMLAGTTGMQAPVSVAVTDNAAIAAIAREHFGFLTPVASHPSAEAALDAVRTGGATVAVLPFALAPEIWAALTRAQPRLYVIARLPFWLARPALVPMADALVIATAAPDASGQDRSFIACASRASLSDAGLTVLAMHGAIAEVEGLIDGTTQTLPPGAIVAGGYAVPVAGDPA